jgi:hypothetical protein
MFMDVHWWGRGAPGGPEGPTWMEREYLPAHLEQEPLDRHCPAEGALGLTELVKFTGHNLNGQNSEPCGKRIWCRTDCCPCCTATWELKAWRGQRGGLFPFPKSYKMIVTGQGWLNMLESPWTLGSRYLHSHSATLHLSLTCLIFFPGEVRMGR